MKKSEFYISIVFIAVFVIIFGISKTTIGAMIAKDFNDAFRTCPPIAAYIDAPIDNISDIYFSKTENYEIKTVPLNSNSNIDSSEIAFLMNPYNIEKYISQFENNGIIAKSTISLLIKNSTIKNVNDVVITTNSYGRKSYTLDLAKILNGFIENKTWDEIGYNGDSKIEVLIPSSNSLTYNYVVLGVYASFYGEYNDKNIAVDMTKKVIDKATVIPVNTKPSSSQIYIVLEQSSDFNNYNTSWGIEYCYPSTSIMFPMYMMWNNDDEFRPIYNELIAGKTTSDQNYFIDNLGYRPVNDVDGYSCYGGRGNRNYWASNAVDYINGINISYTEMSEILNSILN